MNTNWSSPKRNIIAALLDLRKALAAGHNAVLIRACNEDCDYPIMERLWDEDWRNYEFRIGYPATREDIVAETHMSDIEKGLSLSFKNCYGTEEAMNRYYKTGELSDDNFKNTGRSHLVHVKDMIEFFEAKGDTERAEMFRHQYFTEEGQKERHFYDFYRYKHGSPWAIKKFRRKLWVVELLDKNQSKARIPVALKIMNIILSPVFFIMKLTPRKSVLRMDKYRVVTYRIGDVTNGLSVEFYIPRNFSF